MVCFACLSVSFWCTIFTAKILKVFLLVDFEFLNQQECYYTEYCRQVTGIKLCFKGGGGGIVFVFYLVIV